MRRLPTFGLVALATVAASSVIDLPREPGNVNAPLLAGETVPADVRSTIDRACRDCHSEATRYPWYSYVAPVSWLIKRDVRHGREHLNFSKWSEYSVIRRQRCLSEIANQVQDGGMPLAIYTIMHRDAKLSKAEVDALFEWSQAARMRLITQNTSN
jgi:hypothetical protein